MKIELSNFAEAFNKTKDVLVEKTNKVGGYISEETDQAKNYLSELANQSVNSISDAKNESVEVISQTTNNAVSNISEITAQTKEKFAETTEKLTDATTTATNQAVKSLTEVAENIMQTRENFSDRITEVVQNYISPAITEWIKSHPLIIWLLNHPLIALVVGLFLIFIVLGFLQVVSDLAKSLFLFILTSPFKILKSIWSLSNKSTSVEPKFTNKKFSNATDLGKNLTLIGSSTKIENNPQRLIDISIRLEEIKKEQNLLLQEASEILQYQSQSKVK